MQVGGCCVFIVGEGCQLTINGLNRGNFGMLRNNLTRSCNFPAYNGTNICEALLITAIREALFIIGGNWKTKTVKH